jgi:hypothetical protein
MKEKMNVRKILAKPKSNGNLSGFAVSSRNVRLRRRQMEIASAAEPLNSLPKTNNLLRTADQPPILRRIRARP